MQRFVIRRAFLVPLGLLLLLCLSLLVITVLHHEPPVKLLVLGCVLLPLGLLFVESCGRRIEIDGNTLRAVRLGRQRTLQLDRVTALEAVSLRKRILLTLSVGDEFVIISNSYGNFAALLDLLIATVPEPAISDEVRQLRQAPLIKHSDVVSVWLLNAVMLYILYVQLVR